MARRILIDKSENRLWLYEDGKVIRTYPVATGKASSITPVGTFSVVFKTTCPGWDTPTDEFVPGCTPQNPLGTRWIGLGVGSTGGKKYGIHGTNQPSSIGSHITLGCVRMQNWAVEDLYGLVPLGTMVTIRP